MLPSSLRASHNSSNTGRKPAADSTRSLRFSDEEDRLCQQPAVFSLRSRDAPPTNSSEKLKFRLNEAVANMEANERIEVDEKRRRRRASGRNFITRDRSLTPPVGKDELALRRRRRYSEESWGSSMRHSSSDSPSPSSLSRGSEKTMYPVQLASNTRLGPREREQERAVILHRSRSPEEDEGKGRRVERWRPKKDVMAVERRNGPNDLSLEGSGDDEGRYLFKKQRKLVRRGEEWWVVRREVYAYWKER